MHTLIELLVAASLASSTALPDTSQAGGPPAISLVMPQYPLVARKARMHGYGMVEALIATDGSVSSTLASGTNPLLARAAERSVALWRFSPSEEPRCATVVIEFQLSTGAPDESEYPTPEVSFVSPHYLVLTAPSYPTLVTIIRDPLPQPCFISLEPWGTVVCEEALKHLPLR